MKFKLINESILEAASKIKITGGSCSTKWIYDTMQDSLNIKFSINGHACDFIFRANHGRYVVDGIDCDAAYINDERVNSITTSGGTARSYAISVPGSVMTSEPKENQKDFGFTGQYYKTAPIVKYIKEKLIDLLNNNIGIFSDKFLDKVGLSSGESKQIKESNEWKYFKVKGRLNGGNVTRVEDVVIRVKSEKDIAKYMADLGYSGYTNVREVDSDYTTLGPIKESSASDNEYSYRKRNYERAKSDFEKYGEKDNNDFLSREEKMRIAKSELDRLKESKSSIKTFGAKAKKLTKESLSESSSNMPYKFFYSAVNSTLGYDFEEFAKSLGAKKVYGRYKGTAPGSYFYLVPSEEVYNELKKVAKREYGVEMQRLTPFNSEEYPKLQYISELNESAANSWEEWHNDVVGRDEYELAGPNSITAHVWSYDNDGDWGYALNIKDGSKVIYKKDFEHTPIRDVKKQVEDIVKSYSSNISEALNGYNVDTGDRKRKVRIARANEFDNGHVLYNYKKMTSAEAEEEARQMSIKNPDEVFYVQYDNIMTPHSDIKWKNGKKLTEAHYGGAYDVDDEAYFTKEDLVEFANDVIEAIDRQYDLKFDINELELYKGVLYLSLISKNGIEMFHEQKINMRKIRTPKDLNKYLDEFISAFKFQIDDNADYLYESLLEYSNVSGIGKTVNYGPNRIPDSRKLGDPTAAKVDSRAKTMAAKRAANQEDSTKKNTISKSKSTSSKSKSSANTKRSTDVKSNDKTKLSVNNYEEADYWLNIADTQQEMSDAIEATKHALAKGKISGKDADRIKKLINKKTKAFNLKNNKKVKEDFDYDDLDFNYENDDWDDDDGVAAGKTFIESGSEYKWLKKVGDTVHLDFDNWAVWSAENLDDNITEYFVVDEDTQFIDWGPVDTAEEALEFLQSKVDDYNEDEDDFIEFEESYSSFIREGDKVRVSTPGNATYDGRTGVVDWVDDVVLVIFDDGKKPRMNNFDRGQVTKIDESLSEDGEQSTVKFNDKLVRLPKLADYCDELNDYLKAQGSYERVYPNCCDDLSMTIDSGDWKHDHIWNKNLVFDFFRNKGIDINWDSQEIGDWDDDVYSAEHNFYAVKPVKYDKPVIGESMNSNYSFVEIVNERGRESHERHIFKSVEEMKAYVKQFRLEPSDIDSVVGLNSVEELFE